MPTKVVRQIRHDAVGGLDWGALAPPVTLGDQLTILAVLLLTSKGAAGVTGSGFITLAATLGAISHIPIAGLALLIGVDRFMSEIRTVTNVCGNAVAMVVVAMWEGAFDRTKAGAILLKPAAPEN